MKKQKVVLHRIETGLTTEYKVMRVVNALDPVVGSCLSKSKVEALIRQPNITVEIVPAKAK